LSELTKAGVPAVLVPYPHAAEDHQTANAKTMVEAGASVILRDDEVHDRMLDVVGQLLKDEQSLKRMSVNARSLSRPGVFRYKLDFYYQSALIYLVTLILYGGIRGSFVEKRFEYVIDDPLMYVILFFVLFSFAALLLNKMRDRRLILQENAIVFKNKYREVRIEKADIEWLHIGRESRVRTSGMFQVATFKLKKRRRVFRIRIGRYERARDLLAGMRTFAAQIPGRSRRQWRNRHTTRR
jgi:hypothetical protein